MFLKIAVSQTRHKWGIALLILLAMTSLVTLYVYSSNTAKFANRSMELVMKNMGHNLLILPEQSDPWSVYQCSDGQLLFADGTAERMSQALSLSSRYYVSVLQGRVDVDSHELLLTGIEPVAKGRNSRERQHGSPAGRRKPGSGRRPPGNCRRTSASPCGFWAGNSALSRSCLPKRRWMTAASTSASRAARSY